MVVIVVPAFNEEKNVGHVVSGLFRHGYATVVVVDDGSTDSTAQVAKAAGAVVLQHPINRGQGAALQTGNEYALAQGAELVVHFDADGQFNPADVAPALVPIGSGQADIVFGSRFLDKRSRIPWTKKYVILPIGRFINRLFTGLRLTDAHNGFRILSRRALEVITITHDGMAHNTEIPAQVKKHGLRYVEVPVEVVYHRYGQDLAGGIKILWELVFGFFHK